MNRDEYAVMYAVEDRLWWYVALRAVLQSQWRQYVTSTAPRILDAGCGTGANLDWLRARGTAFGLDFSPDALRFCAARSMTRTAMGSVAALPFPDGAFDVVTSMDVLSHQSLPDKGIPMAEIARVLRPGGLVFINLPAFQCLRSSHDDAVQMDRRFTKRQVAGLCHDAGLSPVRILYWNSLLFAPMALVRLWRRAFPPAHSDLDIGFNEAANRLLLGLMRLEQGIFARIRPPFGLSVFAVAQKPRANN